MQIRVTIISSGTGKFLVDESERCSSYNSRGTHVGAGLARNHGISLTATTGQF